MMIYSENSFYFILQEIRKKPGLYLGSKSLQSFMQFWHGYVLGIASKEWKKSTDGRFETQDKVIDTVMQHAVASNSYPLDQHFMYGFDEFVHKHYNRNRIAMDASSLILENSSSDEEAFDKFFELFDEFLKQKNNAN